jgi:hypothetical protein
MAKLTAATRKVIKTKDFALPKVRKYPIHDRPHQINAKARATQQLKAGNLSKAQHKLITTKANQRLAKTNKTITNGMRRKTIK